MSAVVSRFGVGDGARSRACPVPGCERRVSNALLMCYPHWQRVPAPLQAGVYARYRAFLAARTTLIGPSIDALKEAQRAAIASVNPVAA